jgi:hypothetical protein
VLRMQTPASQQTIISISKTSKPKKTKKGDEKFIVEF